MKHIKDNIQILVIMTMINLIVLWNFISNRQTKHGIGYFIFFYVALVTIHLFTQKFPPKIDIEVKNPKSELSIAMLFSILGVVFLSLNFLLKSTVIPKNIVTTIPIMIGVLLFTFPIALLIYLLLKKYKILQLGLKIKPISYLVLGVIIWALTGLFAYILMKLALFGKKDMKNLVVLEVLLFKELLEQL